MKTSTTKILIIFLFPLLSIVACEEAKSLEEEISNLTEGNFEATIDGIKWVADSAKIKDGGNNHYYFEAIKNLSDTTYEQFLLRIAGFEGAGTYQPDSAQTTFFSFKKITKNSAGKQIASEWHNAEKEPNSGILIITSSEEKVYKGSFHFISTVDFSYDADFVKTDIETHITVTNGKFILKCCSGF